MPSGRRSGTATKAALISALSLAARLCMMGSKSLWLDEAFALEVARLPFGEILGLPSAQIPHAPLHFMLMKLSVAVLGTSEAALRLPSALASGLAVLPLMLLVGRLAGRRAGLWAGLLWALAPYAVSLGQEAWVYGTLAALGLLFASGSLEVWRGRRRLMVPLVLTGAAGIYASPLFGLFIVVGLGLWPVVPEGRRTGIRAPVVVALLLAVLSLPLLLSSAEEMQRRTERQERAGVAAADPSRAAAEAPVVLARLIPGGVLRRPAEPLLAGKKRLLLYALILGTLAGAAVLSGRVLAFRIRLWAAAAAVIPLAVQVFVPMGVRQLSVLWLPLGVVLGAAASRLRWLGPALAAGTALLLVAYYRVPTFPYHRADWRTAAREVSARYREGDAVLVLNRQSGATMWDYYAPDMPFRVSPPRDAVGELLQLASQTGRVWVVKDYWSGMPADEVVRSSGLALQEAVRTGDLMQVVLALPPEGLRR